MLFGISVFGGTILSETDFTENGTIKNYDYRSKGFGTFRGYLPKHWHENGCSWQKSDTTTEIVKDPNGNYLKFSVTGKGTQYFTELPKLQKNTRYRLTAVIRNRSDGMASVLLRAGKPYKVWMSLPVPFSNEWKTWTKTFQFEKDPDPTIVLFLSLRGNGFAVDAASGLYESEPVGCEDGEARIGTVGVGHVHLDSRRYPNPMVPASRAARMGVCGSAPGV